MPRDDEPAEEFAAEYQVDDDDVERVESGGSSAADTVAEFKQNLAERNLVRGLEGFIYAVAVLPVALLAPVLSVLPGTWRIYHKLHLWSVYQMQKSASADVLANVRHPNGKEDVLPAQWVEGAEDENERTGWKVKTLGAKRYHSGINGGESNRMGKADVVHINEDDLRQGSWAEASVDTAFALDRERYLFRDATVQAEQFLLDAGADGAAVADGGYSPANVRTSKVSVSQPGVLEDVLVPVTSRAGYDGQVVSWNQLTNIQQETADQETVRNAKNAGWMAAKMDDINGADLFKWVLILGVIGAVLLFHAEIGAFIAGLGSGNAVGDAVGGSGLGMVSAAKFAVMG